MVALADVGVPGGLQLPDVAAADVLPQPELDEARSFERFLRWSYVASAVVLIGVFAVYARYGVRFAKESAAGRIGTGMLLGMLGLAIVWLVQIPFGILDLWWQRRHDVSELGYVEWVFLNWFALGGEFLFVCFALLIVMGLAGPLGNWWWIPGAFVFVGLAALFTFISPYLIPAQRDAPRALVREADQLAEEQGLSHIPIRIQKVDAWESPNAAATGLGPTPANHPLEHAREALRRRGGARRPRPRARASLSQSSLEGNRLVCALRHPRRVSARVGGEGPRGHA